MKHVTAQRFRTLTLALRFALVAGLMTPLACSDDEEDKRATSRSAPGRSKKSKKGDAASAPAQRGSGQDEPEEVDPGPPRPPVALDGKSFSKRRDPFHSFVATEAVIAEPTPLRAERRVKMANYSFEELKLITIVSAGAGIRPRALFLASDGKSKTIRQGEYFSSSEVKLATVNRDYVEIEVVDTDLGSSLNLQRGERRAIYLRND